MNKSDQKIILITLQHCHRTQDFRHRSCTPRYPWWWWWVHWFPWWWWWWRWICFNRTDGDDKGNLPVSSLPSSLIRMNTIVSMIVKSSRGCWECWGWLFIMVKTYHLDHLPSWDRKLSVRHYHLKIIIENPIPIHLKARQTQGLDTVNGDTYWLYKLLIEFEFWTLEPVH